MKRMVLVNELEKYPVFTLKTVADIIEKDRNYAKLVVYRLKNDRLILEIEKNRYTLQKDPLIVASNIIWPSYISCWSALRYYNLTEQLPQVISVMTTRARRKREIIFNNTRIVFTKIKPKYFFGYRKERHGDFNIFIAEKEKALIDSALFKKISFSEIGDIIKDNIATINVNLLVDYLIKIRNKALIKRFGFLLEDLGIDTYDRVKGFLDYKYIPLDYALAAEGKKDKKWRVIKNAGL
ncbi:MAG: hypothetical protein DRO89_02115 [Candidatus Altiarchaeales archaeon]|nr:MAG: hypothetical protein DRO89_02115 [Candidatus Altiarchaeales archaeon]